MSIIKYLIRFQKKPIVVNNFLFSYYIRSVRRKVNQDNKNSVIDYIVLFGFYFIITVLGMCLMIDENNMRARLYLADRTVIIGGLRHFTLYIIIFAWTGGSFIYIYLHLTEDNKVMKWIEIFEYFQGSKALIDFTHLTLTSEKEDKIKFCAKITVNVTFILFFSLGELYIYQVGYVNVHYFIHLSRFDCKIDF